MKIVLLPGMDGTGILFDPLIRIFPSDVDVDVVCLNEIGGDSYLAQANEISRRIGSENVILVAESYSGPIAHELCNRLRSQILGVVFIASFVSRPSQFSRFSTLVPTAMLNISYIPDQLFNLFCFSGYGSKENINLVRKAIASVSPGIIKQRLCNMARLKLPNEMHNINATYIRPTDDRLVSITALNDLRKIYPSLRVETIIGGHFIAQLKPEECAKAILIAAIT